MRFTSTFAKLSLVTLTIGVFSSCNKEKEELTNIDILRKDDSQAQIIDAANISSPTTWEDRVNGVDYIVNNNLEVNASLVIKPGVTVMFKDGAGIQVNEEGSLQAIGTSSNEIHFTSESGKRGSWRGITILSSKTSNALSYCKVEHGGGNNTYGKANIIIGSGSNVATAEISNSEITAGKYDGLYVSQGSSIHHFSGNKIHTNSEFPMSIHISGASSLDNSNTFSNNGKEFIRLFSNDATPIVQPITIKNLTSNQLIDGTVTSANVFTIQAGADVYMNTHSGIVIDGTNGQAYFNAVGTVAQPINISAIYNGTGVWNSIRFRSSDSNSNRIEYCNISGGGLSSNGFEGMINLESGAGMNNVTIRNSKIMNSASTGIYIQTNNEYNSDISTANSFANCAKGNVIIE